MRRLSIPMVNLFFLCLVLTPHASPQDWYGQRFDDQFDFDELYRKVTPKKVSPQYIQPVLSTPEQCARDCDMDNKIRHCLYNFTLEYYTTMGRACNSCKPDSSNQIKNIPKCQCIEADGFERGMLSINRMLPGPSIQVCQNDKIIVDVHNNVEGMEASLHWHGMWQRGTQYYDGVPFLTQCPILSGTTFRYQFVAENPGTHFYHSHMGLQKIDGQYGSLIVRQPQSVDPHGKMYDHDLPVHVIVLSDWMHEMSIERFPGRLRNGAGQLPVNVLINGKGRWKDTTTNQTTSVQLASFVVANGQKYRFRMVNSFSTVCPAQMIIQGHTLQLIAQDGESVSATPVDTIVSSSGERVDFILHANQSPGAYWIRVQAVGPCADSNIRQFAILRYSNAAETPKTSQPDDLPAGRVYNHPDAICDGKNGNTVCASHLKPMEQVPKELLKKVPDHQIILPYRLFVYNNMTKELFTPGSYPRFMVAPDGDHIISVIDEISFVPPRVPPLSQPVDSSDTCNRNRPLPANCQNPEREPCQCTHTHDIKKGAIVEVVVYNEMRDPMPAHPFHLHGYAFNIFKMGRVPNVRNDMKNGIREILKKHQNTKYEHPPGKDTLVIPGGRYAIFRFKADNPGWWLFHCHFLYHTAIGMSLVFHVGQQHDLPPVPPGFPTCHNSYTPKIA